MFKKGQLVRSKKSACLYSVFSTNNRGSSSICKLRNVFTGGRATVSTQHLELIGNNFKFKGGEVMEELFEELKHHELEEVHFTADNYKVIFLGGLAIGSGDCGHLLLALRAIRTASNRDARADDSEGGCRE